MSLPLRLGYISQAVLQCSIGFYRRRQSKDLGTEQRITSFTPSKKKKLDTACGMGQKMPSLGVICLALCAMQVISFPVSSPASEDDSKVMKCIVEVISDTLSKPSPIPISQDCLETLRGDERIISILRHQNLLKELQELATQEKLDEIPPGTHKSSLGDTSSESTESKRQPEEEEKAGSEQEAPEKSQEDTSTEELESNDIEKREEATGDEEIDNHITDTINDEDLPRETEDNTSHNSKETETESLTVSSESIERQEDAKENPKQDSNESKEEEDDTQRDDKENDSDKDETTLEAENGNEDGKSEAEATQEGGNSHHRETKSYEETSSNELEDSKRFNKMDELAKQLTSKKWVEENSSEEAAHQTEGTKYDAGSKESDGQRPWKHSREDSSERENQIANKRDAEEKKEEEGSANRKTEDQELESLAAIEAELESVAHKLHELRRV
ncbi:chromogranin-A isoform X1 [Pelobates cultripes]|uniref:Chromogranin-A n=1 Tax=Pelobates cultripes TaxID=61616 RepID=A0AAD1WXB2_PELCU|nr:chromogranin-A isoform X1 [Pelobates cultripes]